MQFQLVIFDCDGVLVDSERITNTVFAAMLGELGLPFTLDEMYDQFMGRSMAYCIDKIAALLGRPVPDEFVPAYRARTKLALESSLIAVPGIEQALEQITLPYCVASSGDHHKMRMTLGITGLLPRFDGKLFSVTEVVHPKPAPDVFLYAAERCGAAPEACVVVEDSPTGVTAGIAAGMTVFGYAALTPAHKLTAAGAHRVFSHMADLPALLSSAAADRAW